MSGFVTRPAGPAFLTLCGLATLLTAMVALALNPLLAFVLALGRPAVGHLADPLIFLFFSSFVKIQTSDVYWRHSTEVFLCFHVVNFVKRQAGLQARHG